jgi:hypothetical protein
MTPRPDRLPSPRARQAMRLRATGLSWAEVANRMGIAEVTAGLLGRAAAGKLLRWNCTSDPDYPQALLVRKIRDPATAPATTPNRLAPKGSRSMTDLQTLELMLRRIRDRRAAEHAAGKTILNVDTQDLLLKLADGLASAEPDAARRAIALLDRKDPTR